MRASIDKWWSGCSRSAGVLPIVKIRLGTRGSRLALAQAYAVQADLQKLHSGLEVEIVTIKTSGDRGNRERLGAFVREIQEALLANEVDVALHCLKDLPTAPVEGLSYAAYLRREDARDTLISRGPGLGELGPDAVIGTGSIRRTSQIAARHRGLRFKPLVGNVDTRLRKLIEGEYDAIVLALAGLKRLDLLHDSPDSEGCLRFRVEELRGLVVRPLSLDEMMPAPGQAVLVLETRTDDAATIALVSPFDDEPTRQSSIAERAFMRMFGGGCSVPVAAFASAQEGRLHLNGLVATPDGSEVLSGEEAGACQDAVLAGERLATQIGEQGGFDIVRAVVAAREVQP